MEIYLAKTQGFCTGVTFAVNAVQKALDDYGLPLYVYHEIVHNTHVVNEFRKQGVIFVEELEEVPEGMRVIYSAHGVPPSVIKQASERHLESIDATCSLVTKVHNEAVKFSQMQYEVVLIGHKGHQELIGTAGYVDSQLLHIVENISDIDKLNIDHEAEVAYITQTTLSVDETREMIERLKQMYPKLKAPPRSDLCYATQDRQNAVKELAVFCDTIIICGSQNSSNSNRLRETGEKEGVESYIIESADELDIDILVGKQKLGISSGASVPHLIVDGLVKRIQNHHVGSTVYTFDKQWNKL